MAHNSRIRLPGFWTAGSVILPAEMEALDQAQYQEINGDLGGTWAPTSQILIGGSGMRVSGPFIANNVTTLTVTGTETISPFAFLVADTASFVVLGGLTSLTGTMETLGTGQIQVSNLKGIEVLSGGEIDIDSGGAWRLKLGSTGYMDPGSTVLMNGTSGSEAIINVGAWGVVNFDGANASAIWDSGSKGWFMVGSTLQLDGSVRFTPGSDTQISGTNVSPATWEWGGNSVQTIAAGAQFNDQGTHTNTAGVWAFNGNAINLVGAALTADSGTPVTFSGSLTASGSTTLGGSTSLTMTQPAATAATGINKLISTLQIKAWANVKLTAGQTATLQDGCNIGIVDIDSGDNLFISWETQFANAHYVTFAVYSDNQDGGVMALGVAYTQSQNSATFVFGEVMGTDGIQLNLTTQTGTVWLIAIGRQ